jgi:hypothetical protein
MQNFTASDACRIAVQEASRSENWNRGYKSSLESLGYELIPLSICGPLSDDDIIAPHPISGMTDGWPESVIRRPNRC